MGDCARAFGQQQARLAAAAVTEARAPPTVTETAEEFRKSSNVIIAIFLNFPNDLHVDAKLQNALRSTKCEFGFGPSLHPMGATFPNSDGENYRLYTKVL